MGSRGFTRLPKDLQVSSQVASPPSTYISGHRPHHSFLALRLCMCFCFSLYGCFSKNCEISPCNHIYFKSWKNRNEPRGSWNSYTRLSHIFMLPPWSLPTRVKFNTTEPWYNTRLPTANRQFWHVPPKLQPCAWSPHSAPLDSPKSPDTTLCCILPSSWDIRVCECKVI